MLSRLKTSLYRFYYKTLSPTRHKVVRFKGAEFCVRPDNYIDRRMWIEGGYEVEQIQTMLDAARKTDFDAFLDIGANFGLYSCILGRSGSVPTVHSIECDPRNLNHLYGHIDMNDLFEMIKVHAVAAGDKKGKATLNMAANNNTGRSSLAKAQDNGASLDVEQDTIDHLLNLENQKLLIKIDVEGYEASVLSGMEKTLENNKCFIQMEILSTEDRALESRLEAIGYARTKAIGADVYFTNIKDL